MDGEAESEACSKEELAEEEEIVAILMHTIAQHKTTQRTTDTIRYIYID